MSKVDEAIVEMKAALDAILLENEGLDDLGLLDLGDDAAKEVDSYSTIYKRRVELLNESIGKCQLLIADGYPALPVRFVSEAAYADIADQEASIAAILKKFAPNEKADDLGLKAGEPEPK